MHWPPPKRLSPTPGKRGAGYCSRACDGSGLHSYTITSIKSMKNAITSGASLPSRFVASTKHSVSAPRAD